MLDKILKPIRWFTQRTTMLWILALVFFFVPAPLAQVGKYLGIWAWTASFADGNQIALWLVFIVSRGLFSVTWIGGWYYLCVLAEDKNFFWFKPDSGYTRKEEPSLDKSWIIFVVIVLAVAAVMFGEMAIAIYTGATPFATLKQ